MLNAKTFQMLGLISVFQFFSFSAFSQTRSAVMVTNSGANAGALAAPTNFFAANSNALNAAVNNSHGSGGGGGGGVATLLDGLGTNVLYSSTNVYGPTGNFSVSTITNLAANTIITSNYWPTNIPSGARGTNNFLQAPTLNYALIYNSMIYGGSNSGAFLSDSFSSTSGRFTAGDSGISITQTAPYDYYFPLAIYMDAGSAREAIHLEAVGTAALLAYMGTNQAGAHGANYVTQEAPDGRLEIVGLAQPTAYVALPGAGTWDAPGLGSQTNSPRRIAASATNGNLLVELPALQLGWVKNNGSIFGSSNSVSYTVTRVDTNDANTVTVVALGHPPLDLAGHTNLTVGPGQTLDAWSDGTNAWTSITEPATNAPFPGAILSYFGLGIYGWTAGGWQGYFTNGYTASQTTNFNYLRGTNMMITNPASPPVGTLLTYIVDNVYGSATITNSGPTVSNTVPGFGITNNVTLGGANTPSNMITLRWTGSHW